MRRRDALAAILSLGAAVSLGACEQQTERTGPTGRTWRVGLLLAGWTEAAVASQRRVIVERLERVLKGTKPGELSVDTSTEYELVVNRKAAAALGITIPGSIIARANREIE